MNTPSAASKIRDPVCGMEIEMGSAAATRNYEGETFYFCSSSCAQKFDADPARYARQTFEENHPRSDSVSSEPRDSPERGMRLERYPADRSPTGNTIYTCPMHPQIEQDHPGDCPICGMRLEPKNIGIGDAEENLELRDMTRRFW